jgi:hypothetical protein
VARGWVSSSSIIDDVANLRHLPEVLALAGEGELPLERLSRIACGSATRADVEQFGEVWTTTLVDLLQVGSTAMSLTGRTIGEAVRFGGDARCGSGGAAR